MVGGEGITQIRGQGGIDARACDRAGMSHLKVHEGDVVYGNSMGEIPPIMGP